MKRVPKSGQSAPLHAVEKLRKTSPRKPRPSAGKLSRRDLERLRYATGRTEIDSELPLFDPDGALWQVNREGVLLLGGGRALLLQVAHPLVAAGVARYSDYRSNPIGRLQRTLDLTLTTTFKPAREAIAAIREIERRHARVRGTLESPVGPFPRGTEYDASDPRLMFWVHATLVDTALLVYERFFRRLGSDERIRYYEESKITARLFGIPEKHIPATMQELDEYFQEMIGSEELTIGPAARDIAASILSPPLPLGVKQLAQTTNLFTVGLLPPPIRRRYELSWGPTREATLRTFQTALRMGLPWLPGSLRYWPHVPRN